MQALVYAVERIWVERIASLTSEPAPTLADQPVPLPDAPTIDLVNSDCRWSAIMLAVPTTSRP